MKKIEIKNKKYSNIFPLLKNSDKICHEEKHPLKNIPIKDNNAIIKHSAIKGFSFLKSPI